MVNFERQKNIVRMPIVTLLRNVRNENIIVEKSCRELSKIKTVLAVKIFNFIRMTENCSAI